ncbi:MAG TPA: Clp protease N-terminal domain-containing protein, partial [Thermomicrobiales bacterium]|nr:Clp protease N-terminal domain-containing protein [Thermomicrobiales bacterium]
STIEFTVGAGRQSVVGALPRTPRLARALDLARQEARRLRRPVLGTEHLLVGLVEEGEGVAAVILKNFGLTADAVRERAAACAADSPREAGPAGPKSNVLTCRIDDADLETIDALVEAGLRSSRSDAAAWLIHAGIAANQALVERVYGTLAEIRRLRDELQGAPARPRDE